MTFLYFITTWWIVLTVIICFMFAVQLIYFQEKRKNMINSVLMSKWLGFKFLVLNVYSEGEYIVERIKSPLFLNWTKIQYKTNGFEKKWSQTSLNL